MNEVLEYLKQWLEELNEIDRPTYYETELKEQLFDRINKLELEAKNV